VPTVTEHGSDDALIWRSRAVSRTVDPARAAAEARVERLLSAALDLINSPTGEEFTVQKVVERSGLSLRAFYNHFAGKYELLLALFEESVRKTAADLAEETAEVADPVERLRAFTTEYYRLCRSGQPRHSDTHLPNRAMGGFAYQLLFDHPAEAAQAFRPLVVLLTHILDNASDAGAIRSDLDNEQVAGVILQTIMFNAFATTITGAVSDELPARGEMLWTMLLDGLAPGPQ
jgi:AcrR family transcriptional regulator